MTISGMDVDSILGVADRLSSQASRLDDALRGVDRVVAIAMQNWRGPDISQFKTRWEGQYRRAGLSTSRDLRDLADVARRNALAQRETSNTLGGGAVASFPGVIPAGQITPITAGWVKDGLEWLGRTTAAGVEWVADAAEWVGGKVVDGAEWIGATVVAPRVEALIAGAERFDQALEVRDSQWTRLFTEGRVPQVSEVLASGLLVAGTGLGVVLNTATGVDVKVFDPGKPSASQPVPTVVKDNKNTPITDFESLTKATMDVYDNQGIRVDAVTGNDGVIRYVVTIPGTESRGPGDIRSWLGNDNAHNWGSNLWGVAMGSSATYAQAVQQAMVNAGIPTDRSAEVLLTGHSQGGIVASNLAADPAFTSMFKVEGVVTYGSPIDCADLPANSAPVLSIAHGNSIGITSGPLGIPLPKIQLGDLVPQLDLGGAIVPAPGSGNVTDVKLPPVGNSFLNFTANHEQAGYENSLKNAPAAQSQAIAAFEQQNDLGKFYSGEGTPTTSVRVQVSGK